MLNYSVAELRINRKEEEKKERLDDTSDGGDTCFLKKSYARAGGQEKFLQSASRPPTREIF